MHPHVRLLPGRCLNWEASRPRFQDAATLSNYKLYDWSNRQGKDGSQPATFFSHLGILRAESHPSFESCGLFLKELLCASPALCF